MPTPAVKRLVDAFQKIGPNETIPEGTYPVLSTDVFVGSLEDITLRRLAVLIYRCRYLAHRHIEIMDHDTAEVKDYEVPLRRFDIAHLAESILDMSLREMYGYDKLLRLRDGFIVVSLPEHTTSQAIEAATQQINDTLPMH